MTMCRTANPGFVLVLAAAASIVGCALDSPTPRIPLGCSASPPVEAAQPDCNTVANSASWVYVANQLNTPAPIPQGGALVDGLYECTQLDAFGTGTLTGFEVRETVAVTQGGTVLLWAGDALNTNTDTEETLHANTSTTASGDVLTFTDTCGVSIIAVDDQSFSVTSDGFKLFDQGNPLLYVYTFAHSRCSGAY